MTLPASELIALADELREFTALRYSGDCKCGKCQLVPRETIIKTMEALRTATPPAQPAPAATHGKPDGAVWQLEPWQIELDEVIGHLGSAIHQSVASDDRIIMDHVKAAHEIAKIVRRKV